VDQWSGALRVRDNRGSLPLHVALASSVPLDTLRPLVETCVDSLVERNAYGLLPVQVAIAQDVPPMETILYLLEQGPAAVQARDANGETVLSRALECGNRPYALVQLLLQLCPGSAAVRDRRGYLPFHIAAAKDEPLDVVHLLVRVRPDMVCGG
jgi:ankyrin repeat protein